MRVPKTNEVSVEASHPVLRIGGEPERHQVKLKSCLKSRLEIEACREIDEVSLALGFRWMGEKAAGVVVRVCLFLGYCAKLAPCFLVQV